MLPAWVFITLVKCNLVKWVSVALSRNMVPQAQWWWIYEALFLTQNIQAMPLVRFKKTNTISIFLEFFWKSNYWWLFDEANKQLKKYLYYTNRTVMIEWLFSAITCIVFSKVLRFLTVICTSLPVCVKCFGDKLKWQTVTLIQG